MTFVLFPLAGAPQVVINMRTLSFRTKLTKIVVDTTNVTSEHYGKIYQRHHQFSYQFFEED